MTNPDSSKESNIDYDFYVLVSMVKQLPEGVRNPLLRQIEKVHGSVVSHNKAIFERLGEHLDSVRLDILHQQFDLDATKREKEELQDKLDKGF